ncbi:glycosyltransferase family 4 protein [Candidatus Pelagibacter sp.]|nr:glycosyltransferase family 4 protein [Candidatus Pelagibacter sp.]
MKIAFIPSTFLPWIGGAEIQTHNTANKLEELGNQVDIFLLNKENIKNRNYNIIILNKFLISFVFILKYYLNIDFTFLLKKYFKKICKRKKYNVWHFHSVNYKTLLYIKPLKELNQKVVITFQGADIQKDQNIRYGYRFDQKYEDLLKKTLNLTNKVYAISDDVIKELVFFNYPKNKIVKIPNSIEVKKFFEYENSRKDEEIVRFITVARYYEKKKGLDLIEKISKTLIKKNIKFRWTLVGRDSSNLLKKDFIINNKIYFNIEKEINNLDEIYFPHSDLIKLYKSHDAYINLARIESFGITIIEAIAAGLPVISFNTKGANELVVNNENGILVDQYEPKEMADIIIKKLDENYFNKKTNYQKIEMYDLGINTKIIKDNY